MRVRWTLLVVLWAATLARGQAATLLADWKDADRGRTVPVKVYYPAKLSAAAPVVLVSHGLGGSRENMKYLAEHWVGNGYITVHMTHVGSDTGVLTAGRRDQAVQNLLAAANAEQFRNRVGDVHFVLDELERVNKDAKSPLAGKLDLDRIAMAGHSFGSVTTLAGCGQTIQLLPKDQQPGDPRIKCGIAFSPAPPRAGDAKRAFADIKIPIFHWTGTKDETPVPGDASPEQRRVPFDAMNGSDQYLVIFKDGDHMVFSGRMARGRENGRDAAFKSMIEEGTLKFLDAYLKGDEKAKAWLAKDAKAKLGDNGTFEMKLKPGSATDGH